MTGLESPFSAPEWLTPFDGSGLDWHESLPSPYTYQADDFNKLVAAVHEYECKVLRLEQREKNLRRALEDSQAARLLPPPGELEGLRTLYGAKFNAISAALGHISEGLRLFSEGDDSEDVMENFRIAERILVDA